MRSETPLPTPGRDSGFSLVEVLLTLAVTLILFLGVLATLDVNSRVTRVQTHVADMQQSLRIAQNDMVRLIRMAGRGGLPAADAVAGPFPTGLALNVRDNVAAGQLLVAGENNTLIQEGTDVVTVRGVFSTPIYQIDITSQNEQRTAGDFILKPELNPNPTNGTIVVRAITPKGAPQDLSPLRDAINNNIPEALILGSSMDDTIYAVVELRGGRVNADSIEADFQIRGGTPRTDQYRALSRGGDFPAELRSVAYLGILEQYTYYVRADRAIDNDPASELTPKLSRARLYPGTAWHYRNERNRDEDRANAWIDLADNILDLQVALGIDSSVSGRTTDDANEIGVDDTIVELANGAGDDWLLNGTADVSTDAIWRTNPPPPLFYLRVSTLARTDRRDPGYQAPLLPARIENRAYAANSPFNSRAERMYRRRVLQTLIDLRNLS